MKVSELIVRLEQLKQEHGDIPVAVAELHDYWGSLFSELQQVSITVEDAALEGPKKGVYTKSVVFRY